MTAVGAQAWYHGGVPGLRRGGKILPPSVTGAISVADKVIDAPDDIRARVGAVHDQNVVYLARDIENARLWASLHPAYGGRHRGGDLYEVTPDGPLGPDPDYLPGDGGSMTCCSATITRVVERRVARPSPEQIALLAGGRP
jgi:hypothetical protein